MKVLGVELRFPSQSDLMLVPFCGLLGAVIGALLLRITHGSSTVAAAMAAAGICAGLLVSAGANLDAGWRGAAIALAGGLGSFGLALAIL